MPSAAFNAWIADSYAERVVLCALVLAEQTSGSGWTSESPTYPNTYSLTLSPYIASSIVAGGVYRDINGVRENATDYTERVSIALVDANASSWYYDEANTTMYVRTSTGSDPDTFASILVFFAIMGSTSAKALVRLFEPMLVGELPVVSLEAEDIIFGIKALEEGNLDWQNAHKFWDTVSQDYIWKNKKAIFYIGGGTLSFSDYEKIAVMRIEDAAIGDEICRFRLAHMGTVLDKILPLNTFTKTDYPNLGEGVEGTYKPILWGSKRDIPCKLTDSTLGANVWLVSDADAHELTAITTVRAVDSNGAQHGLTENIEYTKSLVRRMGVAAT
jgi:hypothetical protein